MTNCEECAYYDYDPETDTNFCEADLDEDEMERSALPTMPVRFIASEMNTVPRGGSERASFWRSF